MSMLRNLEAKLGGLVEGAFGRAFKTRVEPVELAHKLAKEMEENQMQSVSRVYVPNHYRVFLSPQDREQFASYEQSLLGELQDYLAEHARTENYALLSRPKVLMETDDDLDLGEFGIATRMVQPDARAAAGEPAGQLEPGATMIYKPRQLPTTEAAAPEELGIEREVVALTVNGQRHVVDKRRVVLGRSRECDIQLSDPNVSRRHAELRQEGAAYWIVDLDSTNGIEVNGQPQRRAKLDSGDRITLGSTDVEFTRELP